MCSAGARAGGCERAAERALRLGVSWCNELMTMHVPLPLWFLYVLHEWSVACLCFPILHYRYGGTPRAAQPELPPCIHAL